MLLKATKAINVKGDNVDQDAGIDLVRRVLQSPIRQIAEGTISTQSDASMGSQRAGTP